MFFGLNATPTPIVFKMKDETDHATGVTGLTVAVRWKKPGANFVTGAGAVVERSSGWYEYTPAAAELDTLGQNAFEATGAGADAWEDILIVGHFDPTLVGFGQVIVLGPLTVTSNAGNGAGDAIQIDAFRDHGKTFSFSVLDENNKPVDLSSMTLRFVVFDDADPAVGVFDVEAVGITVSGNNNEIASVAVDKANFPTARTDLHWILSDTVAEIVHSHGDLTVKPAVANVP